jgi:hypothetical protein
MKYFLDKFRDQLMQYDNERRRELKCQKEPFLINHFSENK